MISYALLRFGMLKLTSGAFMPWLVLLGCIVTFVTSAQAGKQFWQAMRQKQSLPPIALIPFMAIAVTIAMAGTAFNSL